MQSPDFITKLMPKIVPQTKIAFIGYALVVLSYVIMMIMTKAYAVLNWIVLAFLLVILVFGPYIINCTVVGQCNIAAWVLGLYVLLTGVAWIFAALMGVYGSGSKASYGKFPSKFSSSKK